MKKYLPITLISVFLWLALTSASLPVHSNQPITTEAVSISTPNPPVEKVKAKKRKHKKKKLKKRPKRTKSAAFGGLAMGLGIVACIAAVVIMFSHLILAIACIFGCSYGFGMMIAPIVAVVFGVLALIFGIMGMVKHKEEGIGSRGMALAGIIMGAVALGIAFLYWLIYLLAVLTP